MYGGFALLDHSLLVTCNKTALINLLHRGNLTLTAVQFITRNSNFYDSKILEFKVDRLQIILVAKKYICAGRNCSSVRCLKYLQFHNWFRLH